MEGARHLESPVKIDAEHFQTVQKIKSNVELVFYGKGQAIDLALVGLISAGHVLIEDVPGVGKTLFAKALSRSIDGTFQRIQFTPDLLPTDVVGVSIYDTKRGDFVFRPGPVFANIVLADEINRTTPRTQSCLLQAMNDKEVSVDRDTHDLPSPFMVLATQNPHEFEGTYPLPESELDRFLLQISVGYPEADHEKRILRDYVTTDSADELEPVVSSEAVLAVQKAVAGVEVNAELVDYLMEIVHRTRETEELEFGASPRASLALYRASQARALVEGRDYCVPDDVKRLVQPILAHRLMARGGAEGIHNGVAAVLE
jgi:MoxR-like ATPase